MRSAVPALGLRAPIRNTTAQAVAREVVALAASGLKRRKRLDAKGRDESHHLAGAMEIAESGVTQAEQLLAKYHGPWKRDIRRTFTEALI